MCVRVLERCAHCVSVLSLIAALAGTARAQAPGAALPPQPLAFVQNRGQWDPGVFFRADAGPMRVWLTAQGWTFTIEQVEGPAREPGLLRRREPSPQTLRGVAVRMTFEDTAPALPPRGEQRLAGVWNYFLGDDPRRWASGVPAHAVVRYESLYPGVDLIVRERDGHVEYDLEVARDGDLDRVVVHCEGNDGMRLAADGALLLDSGLGPVRQTPPIAWHVLPDGGHEPVVCRFALRGPQRFGFVVPDRRAGVPLVIDPGLVWGTYLGGGQNDENAETGHSVARASNGDAIVGGRTLSANFPATPGAYQSTFAGPTVDGFVARLDPAGQLVWCTLLGGSGVGGGLTEQVLAVAPIGTDDVAVAGQTVSADFPVTLGAFDTTHNGAHDAFVARLDWDPLTQTQTLAWSTFVGGVADDLGSDLLIDSMGSIVVTGGTHSPNFPVTAGAHDTSHNGGQDGFVAVVDGSGSSVRSATFLGGANDDLAWSLAMDPGGRLFVQGDTWSPGFPVTIGAYDTSHNGSADTFVTQLDGALSRIDWSTFLGGTDEDSAYPLAVGPTGRLYAAGWTRSMDFPLTSGAYQASHGGGRDAYVVLLDPTQPSQEQLVWSTLLGGANGDGAEAMSVERSGLVTVAGFARSAAFGPTSGAFQPGFGGGNWDGFVVRLDPSKQNAAQMVYGSCLGGSGNDWVSALARESAGGVLVAGPTGSPDFPVTAGSFQPTPGGQLDAFIAHLDMLPTGVERYGPGTAACAWPLYAGVNSWPQAGNRRFAVLGTGAAPSAPGALLLGFRSPPAPILGVQLLQIPVLAVPAIGTAVGSAELGLPLPSNLTAGAQLALQWVFATTVACPGAGGLSASDGLELTIQ